MAKTKQKEIILGITGSIAAYKACEIIREISSRIINVTCVLSKDADKFITPLTLSSLSGNKAYSNMFEVPEEWDPAHTSLAEKANLILIAPATADIIAKLASGIADDLLTCTVLASKAPVLIAPAMHQNMYQAKVTQENIAKLKARGFKFIGPVKGKLSNGQIGLGHIADVKEIVSSALLSLRGRTK